VPTPYGPIDVTWKKSVRRFALTVIVPPGTSGTVGVPASGPSALQVDGHYVRTKKKASKAPAIDASDDRRSGYAYVTGLSSGKHEIVGY
jgi:alpha-L-rhamnosidase